jgi:hypothetical protein
VRPIYEVDQHGELSKAVDDILEDYLEGSNKDQDSNAGQPEVMRADSEVLMNILEATKNVFGLTPAHDH